MFPPSGLSLKAAVFLFDGYMMARKGINRISYNRNFVYVLFHSCFKARQGLIEFTVVRQGGRIPRISLSRHEYPSCQDENSPSQHEYPPSQHVSCWDPVSFLRSKDTGRLLAHDVHYTVSSSTPDGTLILQWRFKSILRQGAEKRSIHRSNHQNVSPQWDSGSVAFLTAGKTVLPVPSATPALLILTNTQVSTNKG